MYSTLHSHNLQFSDKNYFLKSLLQSKQLARSEGSSNEQVPPANIADHSLLKEHFSWSHPLLFMRLWPVCLTSVSLSFHICEMKKLIPVRK